jgi:hypothetical protein
MMRSMLAEVLALAPAAALADPAADLVRSVYESLAAAGDGPGGLMLLSDPDNRNRTMTPRLAAVFDAGDASDEPCIDFAPEIDAQDYDADELMRSLALDSQPADGGGATVTATFTIFGEPRTVVWSLVAGASGLLIDDISGMAGSLAATTCG